MRSSLLEYDRVIDRVKLSRQSTTRPVLIVEGKSDSRFLGRLPTFEGAEIFIAGTRPLVLTAAADAARLSVPRLACVVDRDFDDAVSDAVAANLPLAVYENADLEAMLWHAVTLDRLLTEVASDDKLAHFGGVQRLREQVVQVLRPLSRLRRASALGGWGLRFDDLRLGGKINVRSLTISAQTICDAVWHPDATVEKSVVYAEAMSSLPSALCPTTGIASFEVGMHWR